MIAPCDAFRLSAKRFTLETLRSPAANLQTEATGDDPGTAGKSVSCTNAGRDFGARSSQAILIED
jgi:hypothetical protein